MLHYVVLPSNSSGFKLLHWWIMWLDPILWFCSKTNQQTFTRVARSGGLGCGQFIFVFWNHWTVAAVVVVVVVILDQAFFGQQIRLEKTNLLPQNMVSPRPLETECSLIGSALQMKLPEPLTFLNAERPVCDGRKFSWHWNDHETHWIIICGC